MLDLAFVRSPLPHASIIAINTNVARKAPEVVAVYTAEDLNIPAHHSFMAVSEACARPPLAVGKVRFVGDIVAAVVATSRAAASDAAELVEVDYDPLPVVVDPEDALAPGAPAQFDELGTNLAAGIRSAPDDDPLADAEVVVRARIENQRVAVVPMEGNAIVVLPGAPGDAHELTAYVSAQNGARMAGADGQVVRPLAPQSIRVIAPHVDGGFGGKAGIVAEHSIAITAALTLGQPLKWVETRSENLIGMPHGRAQVQYVELELRQIGYDVAVALTNATPVGAFRGAGRPEASALLERIMDMAAVTLDLDPAEIRRRNFLGPEQFPYQTVVGTRYDSGNYAVALDEALRLADYPALRAEQARRRAAGSRTSLGIGLASYVEITAGGGAREWGSVTVHPDGTATASVGTSGHGQGHPTSFAMLVSDKLGIPLESRPRATAKTPTPGGNRRQSSPHCRSEAAARSWRLSTSSNRIRQLRLKRYLYRAQSLDPACRTGNLRCRCGDPTNDVRQVTMGASRPTPRHVRLTRSLLSSVRTPDWLSQ